MNSPAGLRQHHDKPLVQAFHDVATGTISYLVVDESSAQCVIIDPVLDYDAGSAHTSSHGVDQLIRAVRSQGLQLVWILETHAHADHLSAAQLVRQALGGRVVIGEHIRLVQERFGKLFNLGATFATDGSQFDRLVADHDRLDFGHQWIDVMHTPGHTPACVSYLIGDAVFVGDTLFMPDYGTARADFPGGDACMLFRSIRRIMALPGATRMFVCHDYCPNGREVAWETTVSEQRKTNRQAHIGVDEASFVNWRHKRDAELPAPALLWPSLQVNIRAGHVPEPETNGAHYLKIPLNLNETH